MNDIFQLFLTLDGARIILPFPNFGVAVVWSGGESFSMRSMHTGNEIDLLIERNIKSVEDAVCLIEDWVQECYLPYTIK